MSVEAPVGSPPDGRFRSMRPCLDGNVHNLSRALASIFGMGWDTSTYSRGGACRGANMTWYGIRTRDQEWIQKREVNPGRLPEAVR